MTQGTTSAGEQLLVALTSKAFERSLEVGEPIPAAIIAQDVLTVVEAVERETLIRQVRRRIDDGSALCDWLKEHGGNRERSREASDRCRAYGMGFAQATDHVSLAWGVRLSQHATKIAPGAISPESIADYVEVVRGIREALYEEHARLVEQAAGRRKDEWSDQ